MELNKYQLGQEVWFISSNRINKGYINRIDITCELDDENKPTNINVMYRVYIGISNSLTEAEDRFFPSKQELIESL